MGTTGAVRQPPIASLGGTGIATQGGTLTTLAAGGLARNTLDDGFGDMSVVGGLSVQGTLALSSILQISGGLGLGAERAPSASYVMVAGDSAVFANAAAAAMNVTLFHQQNVLQLVMKTDASANAVTVLPDIGTINGAASWSLPAQYNCAIFYYVVLGHHWYVISQS